jgi:hypothetical protein
VPQTVVSLNETVSCQGEISANNPKKGSFRSHSKTDGRLGSKEWRSNGRVPH